MSETPEAPTQDQYDAELAELQRTERALEFREMKNLNEMRAAMLEETYDPEDWKVIYDERQPGLSEIPCGLTREAINKWRDRSREQYFYGSAHIRRVVRNSMNYVIAKGMAYNVALTEKEGRDKGDKIDDYWKAWAKRNDWGNKQREIVERGKTDGEVYLRFLIRDDDLKPSFMNPEDIYDPTPNTDCPLGIRFEKGFIEDVTAYAWTPKHDSAEPEEWVPAEEVTRWFFLGSPSMGRGIPPLIPSLTRVKQYEGWIRDRILLNKVRASIAILKTYAGATPSQIQTQRNNASSGTTIDPKSGKTVYHEQIRPGSVVHAGSNVAYSYLTPNVQASDVRHDGRQILLDLAASVGQPEFMVTMDASNANFASTMVAEAPGIKQFEADQGICMIGFEDVWQRVVSYGQLTGAIPMTEGTDFDSNQSGYDVMIQPPSLVSRNRLDETKADQILVGEQAMSIVTMQQRADLDPDAERQQMELESGESVGSPAHNGDNGRNDDGDDAEEDEEA